MLAPPGEAEPHPQGEQRAAAHSISRDQRTGSGLRFWGTPQTTLICIWLFLAFCFFSRAAGVGGSVSKAGVFKGT